MDRCRAGAAGSGAPRARRGRERAPAAARSSAAAPLLERQALGCRACARCLAPPWRHEEHEDGELLSFFTGGRATWCCGPRNCVLRRRTAISCAPAALTPDESRADLHRLDGRRLPLDGHAGPREHQPLPLHLPQLPRAVSRATGSGSSWRSTGAWQLLGVPSAFEMTPEFLPLDLPARGTACSKCVASAGATRTSSALSLPVLDGPPVRFLVSHHVALNGDDGSAGAAAPWRREGMTSSWRAVPGASSAAVSRTVASSSRRRPAPVQRSAATSCYSRTGGRAASRFCAS